MININSYEALAVLLSVFLIILLIVAACILTKNPFYNIKNISKKETTDKKEQESKDAAQRLADEYNNNIKNPITYVESLSTDRVFASCCFHEIAGIKQISTDEGVRYELDVRNIHYGDEELCTITKKVCKNNYNESSDCRHCYIAMVYMIETELK